MAASYSSSSVSLKRWIQPRRGQIKPHIFKSLIKKVAAAALMRRIGAPMAPQDSRSDLVIIPTTPPSSSYNSDE